MPTIDRMDPTVMQSPEIRDLITGYFRAFTVGDPDWVERHVSRGDELRLIGTNAEEWLQGADGFDRFRGEAATATGALTAELADIEAYATSEVGWGAARLTFTTADGATARARFSVVFERRDRVWVMVASHTSVPVADEDAFTT